MADKKWLSPEHFLVLNHKISFFQNNDGWVFDGFAINYPNICSDIIGIKIVSTTVDSLARTKDRITSKAAFIFVDTTSWRLIGDHGFGLLTYLLRVPRWCGK